MRPHLLANGISIILKVLILGLLDMVLTLRFRSNGQRVLEAENFLLVDYGLTVIKSLSHIITSSMIAKII